MNNAAATPPRVLRGMLLIPIAVILFAIMDTISKYLTRHYPVTNVLWVRYLFHTLLVVAVIAPRHGMTLIRTERLGIQVLRGLLLAGASLLPLGTAILFASYQVLTRHFAGRESPYTLIFYPGIVGMLLLTLTLPLAWTPPQSMTHLALLAIAGMIGGSSHLLLIRAYELAPASRLAPFSYTQLIWVTLAGYIVFGNFPDGLSLAGIAILMTSGIYIATRQHLQDRKKPIGNE